MMRLENIKISQVQALVKNASQDGVCISHCYFFKGELVEGIIQLPSLVPGRITLPNNNHPPRDLRIIRMTDAFETEPIFTIDSITELGDLFLGICLPKAA